MTTKRKPKKTSKKRAVLPLKKIKRKPTGRRRASGAIVQSVEKRRYPVQSVLAMPPEPETMEALEIETERKLSAKIIVGKRIGQVTEPKDLFTVIGIATGIRIGQSNYGEWTGLKGEFEVVRCDDGKVLQAPIMILPDAAMALLHPVWPCQFAFLVRVVPSSNDAGFEYEVVKVVEPGPYDALEDLRVQLRSNRVQGGNNAS
jgi:hypothetical protein